MAFRNSCCGCGCGSLRWAASCPPPQGSRLACVFLGRSVCDSDFLLVRREVSSFLVLLVRREVSFSFVLMVCSARRIEFLDGCLAVRVVHVTGNVTALGITWCQEQRLFCHNVVLFISHVVSTKRNNSEDNSPASQIAQLRDFDYKILLCLCGAPPRATPYPAQLHSPQSLGSASRGFEKFRNYDFCFVWRPAPRHTVPSTAPLP